MKRIFFVLVLCLMGGEGFAQEAYPKDWLHLSFEQRNIHGINSIAAYALLKGRTAKPVIVAVIDSGIDTDHEDLKEAIWVNPGEIAGDGKDNDNNGYIDDIHGWSFISGPEGDVDKDTYELTRVYKSLKEKYEGKTEAEATDKAEFRFFKEIEEKYQQALNDAMRTGMTAIGFYRAYERFNRLLLAYVGKSTDDELTMEDVQAIESEDEMIQQAQGLMAYVIQNDYGEEKIKEYMEYAQNKLKYNLNLDFDGRAIVGDDYQNLSERSYGTNRIKGPDAQHGTHVAGIIAAIRGNEKGIDGVADQVKIMVLRAVPGGDERDKDIANAIYYAVDNGARVINMSFGKAYSPQKEAVDKAMLYAAQKGVLLVHAAGNEAKNTENEPSYPTEETLTGQRISTWMEIGASSWKANEELPADFSNYGQRVDVFAPGVDIYATVPDNGYEALSGTSMAAPVVSGLAALLMSYFPELSALEVKKIILDSATPLKKQMVIKPGSEAAEEETEEGEAEAKPELVKFKELSRVGGVVNAHQAVLLALKKSKKK